VVGAPGFIPAYPSTLPHCDDSFVVSLEAFSPSAVETFMKIERPQASTSPSTTGHYRAIGEFYLAIEDGVKALCAAHGERAVFTGDSARQVTAGMLPYRGSGGIIPVYDLESALSALDEIEEQGEGLKHDVVWDGDHRHARLLSSLPLRSFVSQAVLRRNPRARRIRRHRDRGHAAECRARRTSRRRSDHARRRWRAVHRDRLLR
jgi:hypothetical protein